MNRHDPDDGGIRLERLRSSRDEDEVHAADDDEDLDAQVLAPRRSSESSTESFELYTPDEERAVLKKLDINLVLFMSFLYMLSFLDRSSMSLMSALFYACFEDSKIVIAASGSGVVLGVASRYTTNRDYRRHRQCKDRWNDPGSESER